MAPALDAADRLVAILGLGDGEDGHLGIPRPVGAPVANRVEQHQPAGVGIEQVDQRRGGQVLAKQWAGLVEGGGDDGPDAVRLQRCGELAPPVEVGVDDEDARLGFASLHGFASVTRVVDGGAVTDVEVIGALFSPPA